MLHYGPSQLSDRTIILYRSVASDGAFDWTNKAVISINGNDSADFTMLRMQREHKVIVQYCIFPAGHFGMKRCRGAGDRST